MTKCQQYRQAVAETVAGATKPHSQAQPDPVRASIATLCPYHDALPFLRVTAQVCLSNALPSPSSSPLPPTPHLPLCVRCRLVCQLRQMHMSMSIDQTAEGRRQSERAIEFAVQSIWQDERRCSACIIICINNII